MGDYTTNIYQGGYSALDPNKNYGSVFSGYNVTAGSLGVTTDPRTANIIKDATTKLASGAKHIELSLISPQLFDSVPTEQLREVRRQAKLLNVDVSVHGPIVEPTGVTEHGFNELNREASERIISDAIQRSQELNPDGNIPVVFHSSAQIPGTEWKQIPWTEKGVEGQAKQLIAVNRETGQMIPLREEKKYYPGMFRPEIEERIERGEITSRDIQAMSPEEKYQPLSEGKIYSPEKNLQVANESEWDNKINQLFFNKERADEILINNQVQIQHVLEAIEKLQREKKNPMEYLSAEEQSAYMKFQDAQNYIKDVDMHARTIFSKAYEFGNEEQRKILIQINEEYKEDLEKYGRRSIAGQSQAMHKLLLNLQGSELAPQMYIPVEQFAVEKSSQTFGNAAFNAFNKFKDPNKTPMIVIENPPAGAGLSTGEDLKNLVVKSREQFVKKAVEEKGMGESEAKEIAEKLIGATWDVGHINMLRKQGFEKKHIIEETEKIAPFVKHVHLSDNFGMEHTELPMGMGNVPMKEIMEKLGKEGFDAKKIIEAGNWWQHFQTNPFLPTIENFGSPIFTGLGPYWNQGVQLQQGYLGGYGMMLPQINYETFGAGFSQLPMELGGQRGGGGAGGRMSGRPME